MANKKLTYKKVLVISVWAILGMGVIVLLVAAITKKNTGHVAGVEIKISGFQNHTFIDKKEVLKILEKINDQKLNKSSLNSIDLSKMENRLEKEKWIKKADLFFDNNNVLQVKVTEREPIARIFTLSDNSFYMDSSLKRLPLSHQFSARLPVFTGFPSDRKASKKSDSILLSEIKVLSEYINSHPFWMAQIDQINITTEETFELIPKLGNQVIRFGDMENYEQKFNKLLAFYKKVETKIGWNQYAVLDVQYKNQVIGIRRDVAEIKADSLKAVQIMEAIITEAEKNSNDSTKIQLPQPTDNNDRIIESPEKNNTSNNDKSKNSGNKNEAVVSSLGQEKPLSTKQSGINQGVVKEPSSNEKPNLTPGDKKNETRKHEVQKRIPKAVMPPKSDY